MIPQYDVDDPDSIDDVSMAGFLRAAWNSQNRPSSVRRWMTRVLPLFSFVVGGPHDFVSSLLLLAWLAVIHALKKQNNNNDDNNTFYQQQELNNYNNMASEGGNWRSRAAGPSTSRDDGPARSSGGGQRGEGWRSGGAGGSGGDGGGDNWRGGGGGGAPSSRPSGERPRLNLKARGAAGSSAPPTEKLSNLSTLDNKEPTSNSRAAAFGSAPSSGGSGMRREVCFSTDK